jgi:hypothetical protein
MSVYYMPMYVDNSCTGDYVCKVIDNATTVCNCVHSPEYYTAIMGVFVVLIVIVVGFVGWVALDWWRSRR